MLLLYSRDMPDRMTSSEIESLFRVKDIIRCCGRPLATVDVSAVSGKGLKDVLIWLEQNAVPKWGLEDLTRIRNMSI